MNNEKPSFLLYRSFYEPIKNLSNEELGKLFRAIYEFQINGTEPSKSDAINMAFQFFKNQFNLDSEKYTKRCEKNSENIRKRWDKNTDSNEYERKRTNTNGSKRTDKDKEKDKDKDKDKEKEKDNDILLPFHSERFSKIWDLWKDYKSKHFRFRYKTSVSEQTALKQLQTISNDNEETAIKIIENSVANGYKGLFELKQTSNKSSKGISAEYIKNLENRLK